MEERLKHLIPESIGEKGAWLVALDVMPEHIRLLVEVDPHAQGRNSYLVATTGGGPVAETKRYLRQQRDR